MDIVDSIVMAGAAAAEAAAYLEGLRPVSGGNGHGPRLSHEKELLHV
jgi:hypothetical protein